MREIWVESFSGKSFPKALKLFPSFESPIPLFGIYLEETVEIRTVMDEKVHLSIIINSFKIGSNKNIVKLNFLNLDNEIKADI